MSLLLKLHNCELHAFHDYGRGSQVSLHLCLSCYDSFLLLKLKCVQTFRFTSDLDSSTYDSLSFLRAVFFVLQVSSQISITLQLKFYAVFGIIVRPRLEIVGPILDHDRIEQQCNPNSMDLTISRKNSSFC